VAIFHLPASLISTKHLEPKKLKQVFEYECNSYLLALALSGWSIIGYDKLTNQEGKCGGRET